jgi:hypothetical protein
MYPPIVSLWAVILQCCSMIFFSVSSSLPLLFRPCAMDITRAFLPNAKEAGYSPFPQPLAERDHQLSMSPIAAFQRFTRCCRAAMNRTIVGFCDPSLYQCKDEANLYFTGAAQGNEISRAKLLSMQMQEFNPYDLPWRSKPEYLAYLEREKRLPKRPEGIADEADGKQ